MLFGLIYIVPSAYSGVQTATCELNYKGTEESCYISPRKCIWLIDLDEKSESVLDYNDSQIDWLSWLKGMASLFLQTVRRFSCRP